MPSVPMEQIQKRLNRDNPWWEKAEYRPREDRLPRRLYFAAFQKMALAWNTRRAPVLLGPRRVGKTVILRQLVAELLDTGFDPYRIMYVSLDTPTYHGLGLEQIVDMMPDFNPEKRHFIVFDEIQYLKDWEIHLKSLVDSYPDSKFIASGSAAAALRLKSKESGAGRFSDFMLPPLTFYEFIQFQGYSKRSTFETEQIGTLIEDINWLNDRFIEYLNFGGFPEVASGEIDAGDQDQLISADIVDKVLLRDIPSLYGVQDTQALNRLFTFLAYNSGNEMNLETLAGELEMTKPTIRRYLEYLEAAFLILKVRRIDDNAKSLSRERNFKIHLSNPSMWAALFDRIDPEDSVLVGRLAETAVFAQWQHSVDWQMARYARWKSGEVDLVFLDQTNQKPGSLAELKWTNKAAERPEKELRHLVSFAQKHGRLGADATSKTITQDFMIDGVQVRIHPLSKYCYTAGQIFSIFPILTKSVRQVFDETLNQ